MDHAYWCHVMYTSHGSTCMEGTHVEQKTHVLLTESIALHYTNNLLIDEHNVTHGLFGTTHIKS